MPPRRALALLLVPPFLKYVAGPLLGPSMLAGAGRAAGHRVDIIDLNARFLAYQLPTKTGDPRFVGDHDRPSEDLRTIQRDFRARSAGFLPSPPTELNDDPVQTLPYDHDTLVRAANALADGPDGRWMDEALAAHRDPDVVGVSVLYSGQVLWGLAASILARRRWPGTLVVWGGPHVTALQDRIGEDARYGAVVDRFVFGYAERTFVELLDAVAIGGRLPAEVTPAGVRTRNARDDGSVVPAFTDLALYGTPRVTLPAQASRGCAYGKCRFCTYPAIEGGFRAISDAGLLAVVDEAARIGAAVALKDSLVLPKRLRTVAQAIGGRVSWGACTKLHPSLDRELLFELARGGCATLEFGLETLTPAGQLLIDKKQTPELFLSVLDAAEAARIAVVVNYITGFPGVDPGDDAHWLAFVRGALADRPRLTAKIEHNTFQLERLSPMGRAAVASGLRVTEEWPWTTVLGWERVKEEEAMAG